MSPCFPSLADCDAVQTFQEEPRYTEVNPGDSALLTCKVYNMHGQCSWQKDGLPQGLFTGKYEWSGDRSAGDCSLRVLDVAEVDDGEWECQVTASAFTAQDALTSNIARLVVRVTPDPPYLEVSSTPPEAGRNFTVWEARPADIKCVARYGNPPARFRWFLGSQELPASASRASNSTEPDRPKLWRSESLLQTAYAKADHGRQVRCVALHQAYDTKSLEVSTVLDVQYAPTVILRGAPISDIEEGIDNVSLKCVADSNPPSNVMWRRVGDQNVFSFQDTVQFTPATRKHSATYTCEARNAVGASEPITVNIDVQYPPFEVVVGPGTAVTSGLHNRTTLGCRAGGNPAPGYTWLQHVEGSDRAEVRGHNASLTIDDVTYGHQGSYVCVATNKIKGHERRVKSEPVRLKVVGPPEVRRDIVSPEVQVERDQDALIQMVFCSNPQPRHANWEWGNNHLETGSGNGRFVAETISKLHGISGQDDCYAARLLVQHVDHTDARNYYFNVENDRGADRYAVLLAVREPMPLTVVVSVVVACLALLLTVTLFVLFTFKAEKWCFATGDADFKPTDLESRSEVDNNKPEELHHQQTGTGRQKQPCTSSNSVAHQVPSSVDGGGGGRVVCNGISNANQLVTNERLSGLQFVQRQRDSDSFSKDIFSGATRLFRLGFKHFATRSESDNQYISRQNERLDVFDAEFVAAANTSNISADGSDSHHQELSTSDDGTSERFCSSNGGADVGTRGPPSSMLGRDSVPASGCNTAEATKGHPSPQGQKVLTKGKKVPPEVPPKPSSGGPAARSANVPENESSKIFQMSTGTHTLIRELKSHLRSINNSTLKIDEHDISSELHQHHHYLKNSQQQQPHHNNNNNRNNDNSNFQSSYHGQVPYSDSYQSRDAPKQEDEPPDFSNQAKSGAEQRAYSGHGGRDSNVGDPPRSGLTTGRTMGVGTDGQEDGIVQGSCQNEWGDGVQEGVGRVGRTEGWHMGRQAGAARWQHERLKIEDEDRRLEERTRELNQSNVRNKMWKDENENHEVIKILSGKKYGKRLVIDEKSIIPVEMAKNSEMEEASIENTNSSKSFTVMKRMWRRMSDIRSEGDETESKMRFTKNVFKAEMIVKEPHERVSSTTEVNSTQNDCSSPAIAGRQDSNTNQRPSSMTCRNSLQLTSNVGHSVPKSFGPTTAADNIHSHEVAAARDVLLDSSSLCATEFNSTNRSTEFNSTIRSTSAVVEGRFKHLLQSNGSVDKIKRRICVEKVANINNLRRCGSIPCLLSGDHVVPAAPALADCAEEAKICRLLLQKRQRKEFQHSPGMVGTSARYKNRPPLPNSIAKCVVLNEGIHTLKKQSNSSLNCPASQEPIENSTFRIMVSDNVNTQKSSMSDAKESRASDATQNQQGGLVRLNNTFGTSTEDISPYFDSCIYRTDYYPRTDEDKAEDVQTEVSSDLNVTDQSLKYAPAEASITSPETTASKLFKPENPAESENSCPAKPDSPSTIAYAELSFPPARGSVVREHRKQTKYITLLYPPPFPKVTVNKYDKINI